jgi:hypothetical protein
MFSLALRTWTCNTYHRTARVRTRNGHASRTYIRAYNKMLGTHARVMSHRTRAPRQLGLAARARARMHARSRSHARVRITRHTSASRTAWATRTCARATVPAGQDGSCGAHDRTHTPGMLRTHAHCYPPPARAFQTRTPA